MDDVHYHHVDVFTQSPFGGNSLAVFPHADGLSGSQMLTLTQELRHFESVFLEPLGGTDTFRARIFDLLEELDFAGHPLMGAAAVLHSLTGDAQPHQWTFQLAHKSAVVETGKTIGGYFASLDQGRPDFLPSTSNKCRLRLAAALNLEESDLSPRYPLEVVSTGLRYLIVPMQRGLERARIVDREFATLLASFGAQFAYALDVHRMEGRHWNNDGLTEDVATGSAAGTVGAYAVRHGLVAPEETFVLHQGRFTGRPSQMRVCASGSRAHVNRVVVGGHVAMVGQGAFHSLPKVRA